MATQDWFNAIVFDVQPGDGASADVHNANVIIYTATREIMLSLWFHLVFGTTDQWDVTLTMDNRDHSGNTSLATDEPALPYPLGDSDDGSGATGAYQGPYVWSGLYGSGIVGYCAVPSYARIGPGLHTLEFNEVDGNFYVNFDGVWYDLSPAQGPESYSTPIVCYTTTEDGWFDAPSCWPTYTAGCSTTGRPKKPQGSLFVVYGDGAVPPTTAPGTLTFKYVATTGISFDARGVFWTNFHKSFET